MTQRDTDGRARTPEEIQAEIERSRSAVHQDIKAIGERFTPDNIKNNAKGVLSDAKHEGATMIRETKDKAVDSLRSARDEALESASGIAHDLGDRAREAGHLTADYAHRAGDYAQRAGAATADYARRAGSATGEFVTANAIPLSLIGLGVGWLALSLRRAGERPYLDDDFEYGGNDAGIEDNRVGDRGRTRGRTNALAHQARVRAEEIAHSARDRATDLADGARERVGAVADSARQLADSARERVGALAERANQSVDAARVRVTDGAVQLGQQASELSHEARERLHRAQMRTRDFADENPLAVGAIAIAAGVGVGLLLPATQPENRLMGDTRDRLVGDARGLIQEARETGSRVGQSAREAAQELRGAVSDARISH